MQMALDAYNNFDYSNLTSVKKLENAMLSIRAALSETEQEPKKAIVLRCQKNKTVGIYMEDGQEITRAELPHKPWKPLTVQEAKAAYKEMAQEYSYLDFALAIESKLREKNADQ